MSPRAGLDQAQVLQAASQIIDAEGLEALTLAAVAQRLGVRTPSLYNHVSGLPGLKRDLALLGTRQLCARLAYAAIGKTTDDAVVGLADAFRDYIKAHPGLYALTVSAISPHTSQDRDLTEAEDEVVNVVLTVLAAYGLQGEPAVHAVHGLRSVVHGFATLEMAGGFGLPLNTDTSFRMLIQMLIAGIRKLAESP